jgi:hypothetical protein
MVMPNVLDAKSARELITNAVTALGGKDAAENVQPSVDAALELARETVIASQESEGSRELALTSVRVKLHDPSDQDDGNPPTVVYDTRTPIDWGPKPRTPIRVGGGTCFSVTVTTTDANGNKSTTTVTICIDWETT